MATPTHPFKCTICDMAFRTKEMRDAHVQDDHSAGERLTGKKIVVTTVSTAVRFQINLVDGKAEGTLGFQNTEAHCRSVAAFLSKLLPNMAVSCTFLTSAATWQVFALYKNGVQVA